MCEDGELSKGKPNLATASATIEFVAHTGRLNVKRDTEEKRQRGSELDDGNESKEEEEE